MRRKNPSPAIQQSERSKRVRDSNLGFTLADFTHELELEQARFPSRHGRWQNYEPVDGALYPRSTSITDSYEF